MTDAIQQRVEQFVQEILSLVERARRESRAAALDRATTVLAEMGRPTKPRTPADAAKSSRHERGRGRMTSAATSEAAPTTSAKSEERSRRTLEAAPATQRPRRPRPVASPSATDTSEASATAAAPSSREGASNGTGSPSSAREAAVLNAARALVRATASEIAGRCGQPNGSVAVALRSLVARGQVVKAETTRGLEYSLVSPGGARPFKRAKTGRGASLL
jgi:hypothetical protein